MTVSTTIATNEYVGNGSITTYEYTFVAYDTSHVKVEIDGAEATAGVLIDANSNNVGGLVTLDAAPADGAEIVIRREVPVTQELDLVRYGRFPAENIERALDEGVMIDQQLEDYAKNKVLNLSGGANVMGQDLNMNGYQVKNVADPEDRRDAVNLSHLNTRLESVAGGGDSQDIDYRIWGGRFVGTFTSGFIYTRNTDVARGQDGKYYRYVGNDSYPVAVSAGTVASDFSELYGVTNQNTSTYLSLKIFQSHTSGGLTEISTLALAAGQVYEVRNASDNSLATIYSDATGAKEIVQNGTNNVSGSDGVVEFYIYAGDYYIESAAARSNFNSGIIPTLSLVDLASKMEADMIYQVAGFYPEETFGGGDFVLKRNFDKSKHDGATVISRNAIVSWIEQAEALGPLNKENLHASLGQIFSIQSGFGDCFVRVNYSHQQIDLRNFGAAGDGAMNDSTSFIAYNNSILPSLNGRYGDTYLVNKLLTIRSDKLYSGRMSKVVFGDPDTSPYHALITGQNTGDGKSNFEITGWEFENVYTENGEGEFRRCIWVGDNSSDFKIHGNSFNGFYWNVFVASKELGPASTNSDLTYRFPRNFKIYANKMKETLGNAIFLVKGPSDFEIFNNEIEDTGTGRLSLGHAILVDFISASEGGGDDGVKSTNGRIYKNTIKRTRQGGITVAGCDDIHTYENSTSDIGFYTGATGNYPISYGIKYNAVPTGCSVLRNNIGETNDIAIVVAGGVDVIGNTVEDACIVSGASYVRLGTSSAPWVNSECSGNKITRIKGRNVPALSVSGLGSTEGCILGPNIYKGHVKSVSRYLQLVNSASIKPSCNIISQVKSGVSLFSGNSSSTEFLIPHGIDILDNTRLSATVMAGSQDASSGFYASVSGDNIVVTFQAAPPTGVDNVRLIWQALDPLYSL